VGNCSPLINLKNGLYNFERKVRSNVKIVSLESRLSTSLTSVTLTQILTAGGGDVTYDTTLGFEDQITAIALSPIAPALTSEIYKYELKGQNGFDTTVNTSRDNGTTFFTQTLTVQLKRQDPVFHKQFKILAYGRPHIVVRTNGNQFFLAGLYRGCDATAGSVNSGVAYGDFNGYQLTFEAMEEKPANFLDCTTEVDLLTLLGNPTLVTA
jgi:hypothetical protein